LTELTWRETVRDRLEALAWDRVVADVRPFLEIEGETSLLIQENVLQVLR
jgi:hypothetical protein